MTKRKPFAYDPGSMRYRYIESGRAVPERVIRADIRRLSYGARDEMRTLAVQYKNGEITLQEWYDGMRSTMKSSYRAAVDYARGGSNRPFTPQEKGRFGQAMKKQYEYLNRFARDLRDGKIPLDGRFVARAGMYGDAMNAIYEQWRNAEAIKAGYTEERRVLAPAEHCHDTKDRPGCAELAEKGWQPIGTLPAIGAAACYSMCHCHFEYRNPVRKPKSSLLDTDQIRI